MSSSRRTCLVAIAVLVAAFVALYHLLDCGLGGCPEASHAAHSGLSTACLAAVLVGSLAAPAIDSFSGHRRPANHLRPPRRTSRPIRLPLAFSRAARGSS
jgi:hypothetical protein